MKSVIIFCQAPADVQYTLILYEEYKDKASISIFVINVENIYKFLLTLDLTLHQLKFIPYPKDFSFKNPFKIWREKKRIEKLFNGNFNNLQNRDIFFFSHYFDWLTASFVSKLTFDNSVYFIDHCNSGVKREEISNPGVKDLIRLYIVQYITGIKFKLARGITNSILTFSYQEYGVTKKQAFVNEEIYSLYSYKINDNVPENSVLLFESDHSRCNYLSNYENKIIEILKKLKNNGYYIYIKPHPRLGYSKMLDKYNVEILPSYVPGEFIDVSGFLAVVGVETVAIAKFARDDGCPVYSIIDLFEFRDEKVKNSYKEYLVNQSEGKIKFTSSIDNLIRSLS